MSSFSNNTIDFFGLIELPIWSITLLFVLIFLYILIYSFLQVRQVGVLQGKVKTSVDPMLRSFSYVYFIIQLIIFVVVLIIL